jgi:PST family polysaccharide transporter
MALISILTVPLAQISLRNLLIGNLGLQSAGIWQGVTKISDAYLMILTTALSTYYLPKLSALQNDDEIKTEIISGYKLVMPTVIFGAIIIYLCRYYLIDILFTDAFSRMSDLFFFQLLGDVFKMASWLLGYLVLAKSMTKIYITTEIVSSTLYVLLGYLFVDIYGLVGITIAFFVNYVIYFLIMALIFRNYFFKRSNKSVL